MAIWTVGTLNHSLTHSLVESLRKLLSVADLIVDGRNTNQQSQCSPQSNSNSQPEYTRLYLSASTNLALLPALWSSICLDPTLWTAWLGKTCQKLKLPRVQHSGSWDHTSPIATKVVLLNSSTTFGYYVKIPLMLSHRYLDVSVLGLIF